MDAEECRRFWDEKAREEPYWYISSYGEFGDNRDHTEFWVSGQYIWSTLKTSLGYAPRPTDTVVEIGCGIGRLTRVIAPEVGTVHAFDISAEMLAQARRHDLPNATFHLAEGFNLSPLPDCSADVVLAYCVFQHLPSLDALRSYVTEMARVARPGAILSFTLCARTRLDSFMPLMRARAWLRELIDTRGPRGIYRREWTGIRPTTKQARRASPVPLQHSRIFGQWLFQGAGATARPQLLPQRIAELNGSLKSE